MVMSAEILGRMPVLGPLIYPNPEAALNPFGRWASPARPDPGADSDAPLLFIVFQFWACESSRLPLHADLDGVPGAALAHAVQGVAIVHERDPLALRAFQGDGATVGGDDARILVHRARRVRPSASCRHQRVRPVVLDLEHHVTRHAMAAATISAAGRPERSMPGPDELVWDGGTRRVGYRPARDGVAPLRGTTGSERDQSDEGKSRNNPALAHVKVPPHSEALSPREYACFLVVKEGHESDQIRQAEERSESRALQLRRETTCGRGVRSRSARPADSEQTDRNRTGRQAIRWKRRSRV